MDSAKKQIEELRKWEEKILTSEKRTLWQAADESIESRNEILSRRADEFVDGVKSDDVVDSPSRRRFLGWMGAATALMGTAACKRRPDDHLVPYVHKPQGVVYGVPVWYASTASNGYGVLVKTREGRPIKLEGNPDHPVNEGGLDAQTQAEMLNFYNPERLRGPVNSKNKPATWSEVDTFVKSALKAARPGGVRLLTGAVISPTLGSVIKKFADTTKGKHHTMPPLDQDPIARAHEEAMGVFAVPTFRFDKADVVVSVDADFLGSWLRPVEFTKSFSKRRKIHRGDKNVNRLFVFESSFTLTGVAADHRASIAPSHQLNIIMGLANAVSGFGSVTLERAANETGVSLKELKECAEALVKSKGRSIVVAGGCGPQALEVQLACVALNHVLQNYGATLDLDSPMITGYESGENFEPLVADMNAGNVDFLVIQGVNPVYQSKAFSEALSKVKASVVVAHEFNETAGRASFAIGESHFLESWGDAEIRSGVFSIQQPVIEPLFDTRSLGECLLTWTTDAKVDYRAVVQSYWKQNFGSAISFDSWWADQLRKGATTAGSRSRKSGSFKSANLAVTLSAAANEKISAPYELAIYSSVNLRDGAHANNAWLQELPDPISKVTWGNFAAVSPSLASRLGIRSKNATTDVLKLKVGGETLVIPAFIQPGLKSNVVNIAMGYGRESAGSIGTHLGANAASLAILKKGFTQLRGQAVEILKTGESYELAVTQKYFDLQGRDHDILQQLTLSDFLKDPEAAKKAEHKAISLYSDKEFVYPGHKWGMAIDLNSCTGCSACVVSCYSENNIGIAGADQIRKGRHMAWIRMDLYYQGNPDSENVEATYEPMLCQQCDNAPCETVCPVLATVHSNDGLNDMSYNRCVGTRYCANNCPYKVRRFNYFQYTDSLGGKIDMQDPLPMLMNPDVTIRSRGVMEKCTFCVQRIRKTADEFKDQGKKVPDGALKTACQQSCPADAIAFGDLNDPNSDVSKLQALAQSFKVLEVLNTKPSVSYLPRIRNKGTA